MAQKPDSPAVQTAPSAASSQADRQLQPRPKSAPAPEEEDLDPPPPPPFDVNGFDPSAYKWVPVLRKPRKDGWTPQRQKNFIAALAESGCVEHAAIQVGMSVKSCYRLRRSPGAETFAAAWDVALQHAARQLLDVAFDRAFRGTDEPVFDRDGRVTGRRFRQNDRLMMFLLRAYMPERFRHAHRDWRAAGEALPPPAPPMADVLRRLEPAMPPEPHKLMPPDELENALQVAEILDGKLPHYHRGRGDAEPPLAPSPEVERELDRLLHGDADRPPVAKRR